jgi:hypothetical protein
MSDGRAPFADAERFSIDGEAGSETWVMLAMAEVEGVDYALLAKESDLAASSTDMDVAVFRYLRDDDGERSLGDVGDEVTYERVYAHFAELMGLEDSDDDDVIA